MQRKVAREQSMPEEISHILVGHPSVAPAVAQGCAAGADAMLQGVAAVLQVEKLLGKLLLVGYLLPVLQARVGIAGGQPTHGAAEPGRHIVCLLPQILPQLEDGVVLGVILFCGIHKFFPFQKIKIGIVIAYRNCYTFKIF